MKLINYIIIVFRVLFYVAGNVLRIFDGQDIEEVPYPVEKNGTQKKM